MYCQLNHPDGSRRVARMMGVLLTGVVTLLALGSTAQAQPPVGPTDVAAADKIGVTLYQVNGFTGKVPLKKVWKVHPSGDSGQYVLEFASSNMNTTMEWKAKYKMPAGMIFKAFELWTFNGPKQVTTAGADSWDGQTLIDTVTLSPWNMNHVLEQCIAHLTKPDGTFKDSATFDLQASQTEQVRGKGICSPPNAPPGSSSSSSGQATPKTRVTAYIVNAGEKATADRRPQRLTASPDAGRPSDSQLPRPGRPVPPRDPGVGPGRKPATGVMVFPAGQRLPQPSSPAGLSSGEPAGTAAKEKFDRKKPHVNVGTVRKARIVQP